MNTLVILDRDGVVNEDSKDFIKSPAEWHPLPGSLEAIALLNQSKRPVALVTNQSGVGRGLFDLNGLDAIHQKMHEALQTLEGHIDAIFFCPHHPEENCECRKPKPGLFLEALTHFKVKDASEVWAIGDSLRDLEAAHQAGCKPVLVLTGNGQKTQAQLPDALKDILVFENLLEAVQALLPTP